MRYGDATVAAPHDMRQQNDSGTKQCELPGFRHRGGGEMQHAHGIEIKARRTDLRIRVIDRLRAAELDRIVVERVAITDHIHDAHVADVVDI